MVIYGLKSCDTCRKARAALPTAEFRDVREKALNEGEIERLLGQFGDALINRRSTTWRGLSPKERKAPPALLLRQYPALMKRPVIEADGQFHLGWGEEIRKVLL